MTGLKMTDAWVCLKAAGTVDWKVDGTVVQMASSMVAMWAFLKATWKASTAVERWVVAMAE